MIRLPQQFVASASAVAIATWCLATGCSQSTQPAATAGKAEARAKAKAEAIVNNALVPATEQASTAVAAAPAAAAPTESAPPATIADLVKKLAAAADSKERGVVIDEIGAIGQNSLPALGSLVSAFADEEPRVRWHAARAVGLIGEDARSAMPELVKLLGDADPIVVTQAAAALGAIREDDGRPTIPESDASAYTAVVEPLAKTALHSDPRARRAAVRALRRFRSPADMAPIVSRHLADADPAVVVSALHTLADMGDTAVPFLIEALKDPKSRYWAEVALGEIGPEAASATESLAGLVEQGETEERLQAILALAAIGDKASAAAPAIATVLSSGDETLRLPAAFALGRMKSEAGDEALRQLAAGKEPFISGVAAWALARIHPTDAALVADAVARLRAGLADPDAEARAACVNGLSDLAEVMPVDARAEFASDFIRLLGDADPETGRAAGAALIRLGGAAVPALKEKLADPGLRSSVIEILSVVGPAAKPAIAELVRSLGDADTQIRGDAAVALAAIGADAAEAAPALEKIVADSGVDDGLRYAAVYALGRIGPGAASAEPLLRQLAESKDELMATVAVWATLKIKPDDSSLFETAVPLLRRALRGDREMARLEAAVALGDIGPAAASAIPILELVAEEDPVKPVREAAAAALAKIRAK